METERPRELSEIKIELAYRDIRQEAGEESQKGS